ncbi:thiamine phosphate synthase [Virgibacillus halophilus]|uniref:Thiamine-phosphate synthase n=2 Tax=Tigheibacillus halophilus TaxID=361280 RepID=A0ABU5CC57_9BACI|nr:thiamine phosphate synthase [Virgibacillus halophilus]
MGTQNCIKQDPEQILREAISGGITAFQFREKGKGSLTGQAKIAMAMKLRDICYNEDIPFFINDDVDLIELLQVDGVHIGQDDISAAKIREKHPNLAIGLSVFNDAELAVSPLSLIDYIGAGPIYQTTSKEDAKQVTGTKWVESLRSKYPKLPIVGIGGIDTGNAAKVIEAGANGVAVISVITKADNIEEAVTNI